MLEYDVMKSPGLGAFFAGQQRAEQRASNLSALESAALNRQSVLQRMFQEAQLHPFNLERARLGNVGLDLGNQRTQGQLTDDERKRRMEATDKFFEFMQKYDDPEGAVQYSGVPPQFAQKFLQLSPEQRQQLYNSWTERAQRPQKQMKEFESKLKREEVRASKQADYAREEMKQREANHRAQLAAETRLKTAMNRAAGIKNQSYQQYATQLMQQIAEAKKLPENTEEEKAIKYQMLAELANTLDAVVQQDLQRQAFGAQQRQAGQPDIGAMGNIPTVPQPQPVLPGQQLKGQLGQQPTQQPMQPQSRLSPMDQQALQWAQQNPNDPRASQILNKLKQEGKI